MGRWAQGGGAEWVGDGWPRARRYVVPMAVPRRRSASRGMPYTPRMSLRDPSCSTPAPVHHDVLYRSDLLTIRDNRCTRRDPSLSAPREPMPYHEVCFGRQGAWVRHIEGKARVVDAGSVHFLNRGEVHRVSHPYGCRDRNTGFELTDAAVVDVARHHDERPFPLTDITVELRVSALLGVLIRSVRRDSLPSLPSIALDELALTLIRSALRAPPPPALPVVRAETRRRHAALALDVRSLLAEQYDRPLTLAGLAAAVGTSPYHLARVFRAHRGCSLHGALLATRLRAALERIAHGDETLADIAAGTGFADRTHLSRSFKAALGLSPDRFRREGSAALARRLARALQS